MKRLSLKVSNMNLGDCEFYCFACVKIVPFHACLRAFPDIVHERMNCRHMVRPQSGARRKKRFSCKLNILKLNMLKLNVLKLNVLKLNVLTL